MRRAIVRRTKPLVANISASIDNRKETFSNDPTSIVSSGQKKRVLVKTVDGLQPFVSYWLIGGSSQSYSQRRIGWGVASRGWSDFIQNKIRPQMQVGIKRFQIHNPFGLNAGGPMSPDQAIECMNTPGLEHVVEDFVESWKPISGHPDFEVIAYLGKLPGDSSFRNLKPAEWIERALESYRIPLEAGCSIGFDAMAIVDKPEPAYHFLELVTSLCKSYGARTYIEATPKVSDSHLLSHNVFVIEEAAWQKRLSLPAFAKEEIEGEIIRLGVQGKSDNRSTFDYCLETTQSILADGHTASNARWWKLSQDEQRAILQKLDIIE